MRNRPGRHFLQIPGPTNVPGRVLEALARPTIDHRGPEFADLGRACLDGMRRIFRTAGRVYAFPASGTGAWEAPSTGIFIYMPCTPYRVTHIIMLDLSFSMILQNCK